MVTNHRGNAPEEEEEEEEEGETDLRFICSLYYYHFFLFLKQSFHEWNFVCLLWPHCNKRKEEGASWVHLKMFGSISKILALIRPLNGNSIERERERERKKTHFKFQDLFPLLRFSWLYYFNLSIGDTNIVNNEITTEPLRSWANEFGRGWQWRRWQILTQNDESTCLSDAVKRPRRSGKTPRNDTDKALEKGSTIRYSW